jgi:hypothetical protein
MTVGLLILLRFIMIALFFSFRLAWNQELITKVSFPYDIHNWMLICLF